MGRRISFIPFLVSAAAALAAPAYLRHPDLHGDTLVFTAEGDLWVAALSGGPARRLTTHDGTESHACFSPDGKVVAFTGGYDGNRDVFVVAAEGGEPTRLTWHPAVDESVGFTPDGARVVFRSTRQSPHEDLHLFTVPVAGGEPEPVPLGFAVRLDVDPASGLWAFNRSSWETRTWKRYRGGTATTIWVGHPERKDFAQVTRFEGINAFPMWNGGRIYFVSDQGGTANLWSMAPDGSDRKRHTAHERWDVRFPGIAPDGRIVYMLGGDLRLFDPRDGSDRAVAVDLGSDRVLTRRRYPDAAKHVSFMDLAPKADRLAIVTRGDLYSVPVKEGVTLPVAAGSASRVSWASFDAKGERLVYVTDESGEEAIVTADAWGRGKVETVKPAGDSGWHFPPVCAGDGKHVAWADQTQTLWIAPAAGGPARAVDRSDQAEIREYAWSPDGRWLAYAKRDRTDYSSIYLFEVATGTVTRVTGPNTNDTSPAWDPEGRYLYFLGDRTVNPMLDFPDMAYVLLRPTRPYLAILRKDEKNPLAPLAGTPGYEAPEAKEEGGDGGKKDGKKDGTGKDGGEGGDGSKDKPPKRVRVDLDGLGDRIVPLPVPAGIYGQLSATAKRVLYLEYPLRGMVELEEDGDGDPRGTLQAFDLGERKAKPLVSGISSYVLAEQAGKAAIVKKPGDIYVVDVGGGPIDKLDDARVKVSDVVVEVEPRREWEQIYREGWRLMRDFVWEPRLSGLDWKAVREQYAELLPRLATRDDLRDLMGEVIGELATSHTYVWGGDQGVNVPQVATGLLGADLIREGDAFKVVRIYRGDPADNVRSPLAEPEAAVAEGDYILAVNHRPFPKGLPFEASMANLAGRAVVLTVSRAASGAPTRLAVVKPLGNEVRLRYVDWVRCNREHVAARTGGKMGYLHIPDMGTSGLVAFTTWFYPQLGKEGLVVDARWNRGGFVSQMILEKLRRKVVSFDRARGGGVFSYPYRTLNGPFVVVTNEFAGSDGDIFPYSVQSEKLAPVIGKRSWGGVVGIRGDKPLVDGGMITQPEYAWWDPRGGWSMENRGVEPDIEVECLPQDMARGVDAQLDKAVEVLVELARKTPPVRFEAGPEPTKTRDAFRGELTP